MHQNMLKNDLGSLKFDVDKLDIAKLKSASLDLSNLSNVVKDDVVKRSYIMNYLKKLKLFRLFTLAVQLKN